ncbi:MAG TPA: CHAD domain-containing protein [Thermomicrobiales bacterium]|nr:CHAD domain-containing protein [Thermomicrobiales bacterium]HQZ89918.1 CHAD domain-containing protein [Thermomicrobiales bacterium]HRA31483.1 CHAD domain-containing protein [Thermomicrobiales bacterium]
MAKRDRIDGLSGSTEYRFAIGRVIETRFDEMMLHRAGTLLGRDPEQLHDMRVGSRRLRAAMDVATDCFPRRRYGYYHQTIKRLTDVLGGVRDCDVLRETLVAYRRSRPTAEHPAINRMLRDLRVERDARRIDMIAFFETLDADRFDVRFRGFLAEYSRGEG